MRPDVADLTRWSGDDDVDDALLPFCRVLGLHLVPELEEEDDEAEAPGAHPSR